MPSKRANRRGAKPAPLRLQLWFGANRARRLFYFTHPVFTYFLWQQDLFPEDWLVIHGPSVPTAESIAATRSIADGFRLPIVFLGDLSPMDLTAFASLRRGSEDFSTRRSDPLPIHYAGINDDWSDVVRLHWTAMTSMNEVEREHQALLSELVPDLKSLVGRRSMDNLAAGRQCRMETLLATHGHQKGLAKRLIGYMNELGAR